MQKVRLNIVALSHSVTQSHNYAVVLGEEDGVRRLPIVIGGFEAQAIAVALEDMEPSRPLTHDLFKSALDTFGVQIIEVVVSNLLDGVFHAKLICEHHGDIFEIDSRTSDAIAMAVRTGCPIYTFEFILEAAGVVVDDDAETEGTATSPGERPPAKKRIRKKQPMKGYNEMTMKDLNELLQTVISDEDYEKAAKIRDEINRRKQLED